MIPIIAAASLPFFARAAVIRLPRNLRRSSRRFVQSAARQNIVHRRKWIYLSFRYFFRQLRQPRLAPPSAQRSLQQARLPHFDQPVLPILPFLAPPLPASFTIIT